MTIDAIGSVIAGVGALGASRTELAASSGGASTGQPSTTAPVPAAQQDATIVDVSAEALARQRAAEELAAQQAAQTLAAQQAAQDQAAQQAAQDQAARDAAAAVATNLSAVTDAVNSDWAAGTPTVDNAAVQEALDALDEVSRQNNLQAQADAITAGQDQATFEQKAIDDAANATSQQQDNVVLAALNAGVQLAYGSLATPITGDPALRQPGRVETVA